MGTFAYRAIDSRGAKRRGTITAASGRHAREQLRDQGLRIESVEERAAKTVAIGRSNTLRYQNQLTAAIRELATLLQAGVPLLDAIDSVVTQSNRGFHEAMLAVRDQVSSGSSLADAMGRERGIFDEMTIGMIRVGEHAGNLDEVCEQVAAFRERSGELKDRVLTALLYPAIVMTVSVGVTIFLMTVVVPMLLQNLTEIGRPLPLPTLVLKYLSDVLLEHGHWLGFGLFCLSVAIFLAAKSERGQKMIDRLSFSTPVLGSLIQKQALSRMSLVVSSLLRSGVELVDALEIAQKSTTNGLLQSALIEMQGDLRAGKDLRDSTSRQSFFTHSMAQVFSLGQQSGQLDSMLLRLGTEYDRQAGRLATRVTTIIEPVLILVLSVVVGFILFATVLPILEAGNVLSE
ncbi:type II secretion system F family protein [Rhodopirellula europaea]|uniref:General secretion pathway protein F n=1 Tax=Rhodopirellula europaea SH398 TaxID=1263868 RepID=M5S0Q2_9BACT|nr:type II secretion system F family protein [Rhodopirellula europaea]EMI25183.1 type IV pilus biogenesis protein PilC [Rhodopirellula europaea SH398]